MELTSSNHITRTAAWLTWGIWAGSSFHGVYVPYLHAARFLAVYALLLIISSLLAVHVDMITDSASCSNWVIFHTEQQFLDKDACMLCMCCLYAHECGYWFRMLQSTFGVDKEEAEFILNTSLAA